MRHVYLTACVCFSLLSTAFDTQASEVYVQLPGAGSLSQRISSTLNNAGLSPGSRTADDFLVGADAAITDVYWWGQSNSGGSDFQITFYSDSLGIPGAVLQTSAMSSLFTQTDDTGAPSGPSVYYSGALVSPFSANADTTYWISIFNQASDASWLWLSADSAGNGSVQGLNPGPPWAVSPYDPLPPDMSFGLISTVPLPPAVWLLGAGLAGLFGFARRRKANEIAA